MFSIANKQILAEGIKRIDILAPDIAKQAKPGQFVTISAEHGMEKIPLPIVDLDLNRGTIAFVFEEKIKELKVLGSLGINEKVFSIVGPLGEPIKVIGPKKTIVFVGTGLGTISMLPLCRAFKKADNKVISVVGLSNKKRLILEAQLRLSCYKIFISTDDGSYQQRGMATDILEKVLSEEDVSFVYAVGSIQMMRKVCELTKSKGVSMRIYLLPKRGDCVGLCGACRINVAGNQKLICVDGPEFDGHKIDYDELDIRMKSMSGINGGSLCRTNQEKQKPQDGLKTLEKFLGGILKKKL